jgi:hypothetical protein
METNEEVNARDLSMLYEGLVEMVSHSEVSQRATLAVLIKVLVLLALSGGTSKEEFLQQIEYVWDYENFFQPDSNEKH